MVQGLDVPQLLPFARKALAAVLDRTSDSAIVCSHLIGGLLFLKNRAVYQTARRYGAVMSLSDICLACRSPHVQTRGSGQATTEGAEPIGRESRTVVVARFVVQDI